MGLLITLVLGLFILVGAIIVFISKNNNKFINFSISLAFSVITMLIVTDLIPELFEIFEEDNNLFTTILIIVISIFMGFVILKMLDKYVPDHDDEGEENLEHIGVVAAIALVLHNIIEGMAIYTVAEESIRSGLLLAIGIGLHNIPMGMIITSTIYKASKSIKKTLSLVVLTALSTFFGGLAMAILGANSINEFTTGILIGVTLGMLLYIAFSELLPKIIKIKNKKIVLSGIITGIILILIAMII